MAISYRGKAYYEATLTVLALRLWQAEHGDWPGRLDELVAGGYLAELPGDPFSDSILVYRLEEESFALYSVGENFVDDRGEWYDSGGCDGEPGGDRVYWPMREW